MDLVFASNVSNYYIEYNVQRLIFKVVKLQFSSCLFLHVLRVYFLSFFFSRRGKKGTYYESNTPEAFRMEQNIYHRWHSLWLWNLMHDMDLKLGTGLSERNVKYLPRIWVMMLISLLRNDKIARGVALYNNLLSKFIISFCYLHTVIIES